MWARASCDVAASGHAIMTGEVIHTELRVAHLQHKYGNNGLDPGFF